jgi:hypothetical protein
MRSQWENALAAAVGPFNIIGTVLSIRFCAM